MRTEGPKRTSLTVSPTRRSTSLMARGWISTIDQAEEDEARPHPHPPSRRCSCRVPRSSPMPHEPERRIELWRRGFRSQVPGVLSQRGRRLTRRTFPHSAHATPLHEPRCHGAPQVNSCPKASRLSAVPLTPTTDHGVRLPYPDCRSRQRRTTYDAARSRNYSVGARAARGTSHGCMQAEQMIRRRTGFPALRCHCLS